MKMPQTVSEEVRLIRGEGSRAAARLIPFQRLREQRRRARSLVDINQAIHEALRDDPETAAHAQVDLAPGPLSVSVNAFALKQMIHVLLQTQQVGTAPMLVRTCAADGRIGLSVGPASPRSLPSNPVDLLDPEHQNFQAIQPIHRLALQSLARLLDAGITAATGPGGVSLSVSWPFPQ
jgi:hypothetical protein